jgi:hypothetical protein
MQETTPNTIALFFLHLVGYGSMGFLAWWVCGEIDIALSEYAGVHPVVSIGIISLILVSLSMYFVGGKIAFVIAGKIWGAQDQKAFRAAWFSQVPMMPLFFLAFWGVWMPKQLYQEQLQAECAVEAQARVKEQGTSVNHGKVTLYFVYDVQGVEHEASVSVDMSSTYAPGAPLSIFYCDRFPDFAWLQ